MTRMNLSIKQEQTLKHTDRFVTAKGGDRVARDGLGVWDQQMQTTVYRMDKQSLVAYHRELYSISHDISDIMI